MARPFYAVYSVENVPTFLHHDEVFWVGLQSIVAIVALGGLAAYTVFTRKMMKIAEDERRSSLTPRLAGQQVPTGGDSQYFANVCVKVTNVGAGAALDLVYWKRRVSDGYVLCNDVDVQKGQFLAGHLLSGRDVEIRFDFLSIENRTLCVVQAFDVLKGVHQIKYLREAGLNGGIRSIDVYEPHSVSRWEHFMKAARRVKAAIRKYETDLESLIDE